MSPDQWKKKAEELTRATGVHWQARERGATASVGSLEFEVTRMGYRWSNLLDFASNFSEADEALSNLIERLEENIELAQDYLKTAKAMRGAE